MKYYEIHDSYGKVTKFNDLSDALSFDFDCIDKHFIIYHRTESGLNVPIYRWDGEKWCDIGDILSFNERIEQQLKNILMAADSGDFENVVYGCEDILKIIGSQKKVNDWWDLGNHGSS